MRAIALTFVTLIVLLLPAAVSFAADRAEVERDLQKVAAVARAENLPILLLMSASDCPYCDTLKEQVLSPMEISGEYTDQVVIREFMIDGMLDATDFEGNAVSPQDLADNYGVSLTPTMLFLNADGDEVAKRIIGISNIEFTLYYVEQHIAEANSNLQ